MASSIAAKLRYRLQVINKPLSNVNVLPRYQYAPLENSANSIRLVVIMRGTATDPIKVKFITTNLTLGKSSLSSRYSLQELESTLPVGWEVRETVDGRYLFILSKEATTSWNHPIPNFDPNKYELQSSECTEPCFEALSYTWGPEKPSATVTVLTESDSEPQEFALSVRSNLHLALCHLRRVSGDRTMWIDAICINQNDVNERNNQVRCMAAIYKLARAVIVWLGPEKSNSSLAMKTLSYIGKQTAICKGGVTGKAPGAEEQDWYQQGTALPLTHDQWSAIAELLNRAWFRRLWIWQEIHFASIESVVQCGPTEIPWTNFRTAFITLSLKSSLPDGNLRVVLSSLRSFMGLIAELSFSDLLEWSRTRECSDQRDRIYGILGMANDNLRKSIVPKYGDRVFDVYKEAFLQYAEMYNSLELLRHCTFRKDKTSPSWIPDWSQRKRERSFEDRYRASGASEAVFDYVEPGTLEVLGVHVTTISNLRLFVQNRMKEYSKIISRQDLDGKYVTGQAMKDAVASLMSLDITADRMPQLTGVADLSSIRTAIFEQPDITSSWPGWYLQHINNHYRYRSIFKTIDGYIGIGPSAARPGDVISVLLGCSLPIILRPITSDKFAMIGDAFLPGLCDGEALLGSLPFEWKLEWTMDDTTGQWFPIYKHKENNTATADDPRLGDLPSDWVLIQPEATSIEGLRPLQFEDSQTGEISNSDPRLVPAALRARGVDLKAFSLI